MKDFKGIPECSAADFNKAVAVIESCKVPSGTYACIYDAYAPGGSYGNQWWSLDYALTMEGLKHLDFQKALEFIFNLRAIQKSDGRIPLYGAEIFSHVPNIIGPVGSLPKFFEVGYDIAEMSGDSAIKRTVLDVFAKNLEWWFSERQDKETRLVTAVFEETFIPNTLSWAGCYAPMDTNAEIIIGCQNAAKLAIELGETDIAARMQGKADEIEAATYNYLWSEECDCYFPYVIPEKRLHKCKMGSMFLGFRLPDNGRHQRLLAHMLNPAEFNWGIRPLTSVALDDPIFQTVTGKYNGNPAWSGSVWALINDATVKALHCAGLHSHAMELSRATVAAFRGNFAEFLNPFTGSGEGVKEYAWTAGLFIRNIFEEILCQSGTSARTNGQMALA